MQIEASSNVHASVKSPTNSSKLTKGVIFNRYFKETDPANESSWIRIKDFFQNPSDIHRAVRSMANDKNLKSHFKKEHKEHLYEAFISPEFGKLRPYISKIFTSIEPNQLQTFLEKMFAAAFVKNDSFNPLDLLKNIQSVISLQKLEEVTKTKFSHFETTYQSALQTAQMIDGPFAMDAEETKRTIIQTSKYYVLNAIDKAIEFVMMFFNLSELLRPPEQPWEIYNKWHIILQLWTGMTTFLTAVSLAVGNAYLAALIAGTGVLAGSVSLFVYYKWLRPCPDYIDGCINFTFEAAKNNFEPVLSREVCVDNLIHQLGSNLKGSRAHPLLVGPSGVGKTEIVKELARRIVSGNVPDFLKSKKVFFINTADLLSSGSIARIQDRIKNHEKDCIIFFDEIHTAWKGDVSNKESLKLGEKIKSLLDTTPGSFPFVIGATTWDEWLQYISGKIPLERRLELTPVCETDEQQTLLILNNQLYREAPNIRVEEKVLKLLYKLTSNKTDFPKAALPDKAKRVLGKAISQIRAGVDPKIAQSLQALKDERTFLSCSFMRGRGTELVLDSEKGRALLAEFDNLSKQISQKEEELVKEKEKWKKWNDLQEKYNEFRNQLFKMSLRIKNTPKTSDKLQGMLMEFHLMQHYLNTGLLFSIEEFQKKIPNLSTEITEEMILGLVAKEKENQKMKDEQALAMAQAKKPAE